MRIEQEQSPLPSLPNDPVVHLRTALKEYGLQHQNLYEVLNVFCEPQTYSKVCHRIIQETTSYLHTAFPDMPIDAVASALYFSIYDKKTVTAEYYHLPISTRNGSINYEESYGEGEDFVLLSSFETQNGYIIRNPIQVIFSPLFVYEAIKTPLFTYQRIIDLSSHVTDMLYDRDVIEHTSRHMNIRSQALQAEFLHWYRRNNPDYQPTEQQQHCMEVFPAGYHSLPCRSLYLPFTGQGNDN